jgi:hypothetical protein
MSLQFLQKKRIAAQSGPEISAGHGRKTRVRSEVAVFVLPEFD